MEYENLQMKLNELQNDTEFMEQLSQCANVEEIAELLRTAGIEIDPADLENAMAAVSAQRTEEELDEAALDSVSGGILVSTLCTALIWCTIVYVFCCGAEIYIARN